MYYTGMGEKNETLIDGHPTSSPIFFPSPAKQRNKDWTD